MTDLYLAVAIVTTLSVLLGLGAYWTSQHLSRPTGTAITILLTAFLFWHALYLLDDLRIARLLPFSSVMVLGNFWPEAAGLFVGFAWPLIPGRYLRKSVVLFPLLVVAFYKTFMPALANDTPILGDRWDHGVCLQTSRESCSAAAAATILAAHGIPASEQEMAVLCRTTHNGTSMLGLYRGLKLKTAGTQWDVEVFRGTVAEFHGLGGPFLVSVGLKKNETGVDPRYQREWGWEPGLKHTVVLLDFPGPVVLVADPSVGREHWSAQDLQILWYGEALRLIPRK